ncbi:MAG TPA: 4Fe-4S dicluster domain-containing protein [Symbiobacteriaceae bacterium]|nr:4Fe-4S dicluster domain-containing protein [Symbiobacteriaceae bacterium]
MQLGFFINVQRCIGCHTCEVACKETHNLPPGPRWRRVRIVEGGAFPRPFAYAVSMACNHCASPICVQVCPVGAYSRRPDGLVIHDPGRCIGCQYCTYACPYGAPQYNEATGKAGKCGGCHDRVDEGAHPACVDACPVRAIEFGPLEQLERQHPDALATLPVLPDPALTGPSLRIRPRAGVAVRPTRIVDGHHIRRPLEERRMKAFSLVLFAVLSQAAVGQVLVTLFLPGSPVTRLALPLGALGLIIALFHLGTPGGAPRALANLRRSWLSREALLTGLFTLAAGLYGYVWPGWPAGLCAGLLGLAALYAQGMVWQLPTRPEWRHPANLWGPIASALLLGALTVALGGGHSLAALRGLGVTIVAASGCVLVALGLWALHMVSIPRSPMRPDTWFWIRLVAGVGLPIVSGISLALGMEPDVLTTGGALVGAVAGELLGRNLFFRVGFDQLPQF